MFREGYIIYNLMSVSYELNLIFPLVLHSFFLYSFYYFHVYSKVLYEPFSNKPQTQLIWKYRVYG